MKTYHEILQSSISKSGLSLSEISSKLIELGFSTKNSYLSRLQNGKIPPANEKLNVALANILSIDETELLVTAYIEKAPDEIKRFITEADTVESSLEKSLIKLFNLFGPEQLIAKDEIETLINDGYTVENTNLFLKQIVKNMGLLDKWRLHQNSIKEFSLQPSIDDEANKRLNFTMRDLHKYNFNNPTLIIPYFSKIYNGYKSFPEDFLRAEVLDLEYKSNDEYTDENLFFVQAFDNGMSLEGIVEKSKLLIFKDPNFTKLNICLLSIDDQPAVVRRLQEEGDSFLIRPSNPSYPTAIYQKERIDVLGKVVSVWNKTDFI